MMEENGSHPLANFPDQEVPLDAPPPYESIIFETRPDQGNPVRAPAFIFLRFNLCNFISNLPPTSVPCRALLLSEVFRLHLLPRVRLQPLAPLPLQPLRSPWLILCDRGKVWVPMYHIK